MRCTRACPVRAELALQCSRVAALQLKRAAACAPATSAVGLPSSRCSGLYRRSLNKLGP